MDYQRIVELSKVFLGRALRGDFQSEHARDDERAALAATGTADALAQDYAAWRRALLSISAVALTLVVLVSIVSFKPIEETMVDAAHAAAVQQNPYATREQVQANTEQWFGKSNMEVLDGLNGMMLLANVAGAVMVGLAARAWTDLRRSRRLARRGWLAMFVVPLALAALPWSRVLEFQHLPEEQQRALTALIGLQLGIGLFLAIAPKAIALFPGAIRSSMTLKTLLPEHSAPGWVAAIVGPLYAVFLVVMITILNQMTGNFVLVGAILCLMASPLVIVWRANDMLRSHSAGEAVTLVRDTRRLSGTFSLLGIVLFASWILQLDAFSAGDAINFVLAMIGNVLLLTVVGADFVLALLYRGYAQGLEFHGTPMAAELARKFEGLAAAGLTELAMGAKRTPTGD